MMYVDLEALAAQRDERKKAFMEMLTQDEQIAFNKLRQMRKKGQEPYVNNYDENACELIDFMYYLDQVQFARLPAIEAGTVFSIITRMLLFGKESSDQRFDELKKRSSRIKSQRTKRGWKFFKDIFYKHIESGKTVSWARGDVGRLIEVENKERLKNGEKLLGVKKSQNGETKLRPSRKTLERQLVPNE